jgi:restriction endonuclease S subunit
MMQNSSGSTAFGTISSGLIASLPITLLPLHEQRIIGDLLRLSEREQELLNKLAEEKKTYNTLLLNQIYDNMKRGNIK